MNKTVRATAFCSHSQKDSPLHDTQQTPSFASADIGQSNFVAEIEPCCTLTHLGDIESYLFHTATTERKNHTVLLKHITLCSSLE